MSLLKGLKQRIKDRDALDHELEFNLLGAKKDFGMVLDEQEVKILTEKVRDTNDTVHTFELAIDSTDPDDVMWGYKKDGANVVTPFSTVSKCIAEPSVGDTIGNWSYFKDHPEQLQFISNGALCTFADDTGSHLYWKGCGPWGQTPLEYISTVEIEVNASTGNISVIAPNRAYVMKAADTLQAGSSHTIKFGVDSSGNFGYLKEGTGSVIPFKAPNADLLLSWYPWYYSGGYLWAAMAYNCVTGTVWSVVNSGGSIVDNDLVLMSCTRSSTTDTMTLKAKVPINVVVDTCVTTTHTTATYNLAVGETITKSRGGSNNYSTVYVFLVSKA